MLEYKTYAPLFRRILPCLAYAHDVLQRLLAGQDAFFTRFETGNKRFVFEGNSGPKTCKDDEYVSAIFGSDENSCA